MYIHIHIYISYTYTYTPPLYGTATLKEVQAITDLVSFAAPLTLMLHRLNESNAALNGLRSAVRVERASMLTYADIC
jgi:hypothetical protein